MKTINTLAVLSILFIGCTQTNSNKQTKAESEGVILNDPNTGATYSFTSDEGGQLSSTKAVSGGVILDGPHTGATYRFASDDVGQLSLDFSDAFVKKDMNFMSSEHFTDSIFFYPEKGLEKVVMDLETGKKLIQAMHQPYDSITRTVYDIMSVIPSYDTALTVVMFPFSETRYNKDGTIENYRFYERHYIKDGKIMGVRKWSQEE